jgi:hypothetical protein
MFTDILHSLYMKVVEDYEPKPFELPSRHGTSVGI